MTKKHYRLFISSTFEELKDERLDIINFISSKGDIPIGMEFFSSSMSFPEEQIKEKILNSDAVILIVGANSGSQSREDPDKKYVEKEIEWAREFKKPIYPYVCDTSYEASRYLIEIINKIGLSYKNYSKGDSKNSLVQVFKTDYSDIVKHLSNMKNVGLVEAAEFEKFHTIGGINNDALSVSLICDVLEDFSEPKKLIGRMKNHTDLKSYSGYTLWRTLGSIIFNNKNKINIYYDGGASVVYACTSLIDYLTRHPIISCRSEKKFEVYSFTNSPISQLVYFYHSYRKNKSIEPSTLTPNYGYYSDYGVCLGDVMNDPPATTDALWEPKSKYFEYEKKDYKVIEELRSILDPEINTSLVVSSISGYSISNSKQMNGPWVRSFPNYIFKSLLINLNCPIVFLLDDHKWDREMAEDRSINILPEKYLQNECDLPICYVLSTYDREKYDQFISYFKKIGFNKRIMVDPEYKGGLFSTNETIYGVAVFTDSFENKMR